MLKHLNDAKDDNSYGRRSARHGAFTKLTILAEIANREPTGCGVDEIANLVGMHRTTVTRHCEDFVRLGYITKENKLAPYHLTDKVYGDPKLRSYVFKRTIMDKLLELHLPIERPNKFSTIRLKEELYDNPEEDLEELELFDFSNRIGALITKICIDAVSPVPSIRLRDWTFDPNQVPLMGKETDKSVLVWARETISRLSIFEQFCKLNIVSRGQAIYKHVPIKSKAAMSHGHWGPGVETKEQLNEAYKKYVEMMKDAHSTHRKFEPENRKWSRYKMDSENSKKLNARFNSIFPKLSMHLKKLEQDIEKNMQLGKEWMGRYQETEKLKLELDPDHSKCNGELKPVFFDKSGKTKICSKCYRYFQNG